jgi:hypothetical protein
MLELGAGGRALFIEENAEFERRKMARSRPASGLEPTSEPPTISVSRCERTKSRRGGARICDLLDEIAIGIVEDRSEIRFASASEKSVVIRSDRRRCYPGKVEQLA